FSMVPTAISAQAVSPFSTMDAGPRASRRDQKPLTGSFTTWVHATLASVQEAFDGHQLCSASRRLRGVDAPGRRARAGVRAQQEAVDLACCGDPSLRHPLTFFAGRRVRAHEKGEHAGPLKAKAARSPQRFHSVFPHFSTAFSNGKSMVCANTLGAGAALSGP